MVTGLLTTAEAVTKVAPSHVVFSLTMYLLVYAVLLWAYIHTVFAMARRSVTVEEYESEDPSITASVDRGSVDMKGVSA